MADRILIVDDDTALRTMLKAYLAEHGFDTRTAPNGREALFEARSFRPDIVLLDIMMPELDGYQFIHHFRKSDNTPVILLTAKLQESDKVAGLDLGADDYLTKPFGMKELLARVRAVLRRSRRTSEPGSILRGGPVELDREGMSVRVEGAVVNLTPSEFRLLEVLMSVPGRAFSRNALLEDLHDFDADGAHRTVDVHIRNLRSKIERDASQPRLIQTVYGVGYRFADADYDPTGE